MSYKVNTRRNYKNINLIKTNLNNKSNIYNKKLNLMKMIALNNSKISKMKEMNGDKSIQSQKKKTSNLNNS